MMPRYGTIPPEAGPDVRTRSPKLTVVTFTAVAAGALFLVVALAGPHSSRGTMLVSTADQEADDLIAAAAAKVEQQALAGMQSKAGARRPKRPAQQSPKLGESPKLAQKQLKLQSLDDGEDEGDGVDGAGVDFSESRDPPTFYEHYQKGMLGLGATSKWVPEDHPEGHKDCPLHDLDCDELWPWGKVHIKETAPPARESPLGDNMIGLDSTDDAVVPLATSGLLPKVQPYVDRFDHWPEDSKENKDLLYGSARKIISAKYTGVGDTYVPVEQLENPDVVERQTHEGISDLLFGSWQLGFRKPHDHAIRKHVSMFDQPYRQHKAVERGEGHQVFKQENNEPLGLTKGDDAEEEEEEEE